MMTHQSGRMIMDRVVHAWTFVVKIIVTLGLVATWGLLWLMCDVCCGGRAS